MKQGLSGPVLATYALGAIGEQHRVLNVPGRALTDLNEAELSSKSPVSQVSAASVP